MYYVLILWRDCCDDCGSDRTYCGPFTFEQAQQRAKEMLEHFASECIICEKHLIKRTKNESNT